MWKIIILSALSIVANATNIEKFYGEWVQTAYFPVSISNGPLCIKFLFEKIPEDMQCTYSDGSKPQYVHVRMWSAHGEISHQFSMPVKVVDTVAEVMPALALTCRCDDKDIKDRAVLKLVNKDSFILYADIPESKKSSRTEIEINSAYLFMKKVVPESEMIDIMTNTDELKGRQGAVMCAKEDYERNW